MSIAFDRSALTTRLEQAYNSDEELRVLQEFERVVQQVFDPSWSLSRETRAAVLRSIEVGKHPVPLGGLYLRTKKPVV